MGAYPPDAGRCGLQHFRGRAATGHAPADLGAELDKRHMG
ncbi:hypothetical protein MOP88_10180 [Sphingomonas sp. WKB10]|nr:hypothetical protein [Sphingomonas sp. WKB10]